MLSEGTVPELSFTVLNVLKFIKLKTFQHHGALSIIASFVSFEYPLNCAIV